jgi:hypothetical protein
MPTFGLRDQQLGPSPAELRRNKRFKIRKSDQTQAVCREATTTMTPKIKWAVRPLVRSPNWGFLTHSDHLPA